MEFAGERVRSEHTRRAYRSSLKALAEFLGVADERAALEGLLAAGSRGAQALVVRFRQSLLERGLAASTVNVRLSALRSAVKLARISGTSEWDLAVPSVRSSGPTRETRGPDLDDVRRLVEAAGRQESEEKAARDVARLRLLYDLGLRRSEVVGVDLADVDLERGTLAVLRKGGVRALLVELPGETAAALAEWIARRGSRPGGLFVEFSPKGERRRLAAAGVYYIVRRLGEGLGLRVRPDGLRYASNKAVLAVAAERGLVPPEVMLAATGQARRGLCEALSSWQGEICRLIAGSLGVRSRGRPETPHPDASVVSS